MTQRRSTTALAVLLAACTSQKGPSDSDSEPSTTDTVAPSVTLDAPLEGATLVGSVSFEATAADDHGLADVAFLAEGVTLATATVDPWDTTWDSTTLVNGNYVVEARATDLAGNTASDTAAVWVENEGGLATDAVRIINPADGATICGTMTVEALASADEPTVEFALDGAAVSTDDASPYTWTWDTLTAANGPHTIRALATASDGRQGQQTIAVDVENTGAACNNLPSVVFLSPEDATWTWGDVPVVVSATDDGGVIAVEFFADNGLYSADAATPYEAVFPSDDFAEGPHSLKAIATDNEGGAGEAQIQVNIDRTDPVVAIDEPGDGETVSGTTPLTATATDNFEVAGVTFSVDRTLIGEVADAPYTLDLAADTLAYGQHLLEVTALDRAGHQATDTLRFFVDNPPTVVLTSPNDGDTLTGLVNVTATATDDDAVQGIGVYVDGDFRGDLVAGAYGWDTCAESAGAHSLAARATDGGGNAAQDMISVTTDQPLGIEMGTATGALEATTVLLAYTDDDVRVTQVVFDLDGTVLATLTASSAAPGACALSCGCDAWSTDWSTTTLPTGTYTLTATATNTLGETISTAVSVRSDHDGDGDGYDAVDFGGEDCDDREPAIHPGAPEACNLGDDDCDGDIDEDFDADGDGYHDAGACTYGDDCDDVDPDTHPGGEEVCDGADNDCDGDTDMSDEIGTLSVRQGDQVGITTLTDEFHGTAFLATEDGNLQGFAMDLDQYSGSHVYLRVYEATTRWDWTLVTSVESSGCCSMDWYESGTLNIPLVAGHWYVLGVGVVGETYLGLDTSPDLVEEGGLVALGAVYDSSNATPLTISDDPYAYSSDVLRIDVDTIADIDIDDDADTYTEFCGDCDDADDALNPGATEICADAMDNDCDSLVDEFFDTDGDGVTTCTDCDDADGTAYPGAPESCDHVDDDCDGVVDDDPVDGTMLHADADLDAYGDPVATSSECVWTVGWTTDTTDCDDVDPTSYPGAPEVCDGADNDCDGTTDEGYDADGDGWGDCVDCDDTNAAISPDAIDLCDGVDDNCDGLLDNSGVFIDDARTVGGTSCYNYTYDTFVGNVYQANQPMTLDSFQGAFRIQSSYDTFQALVLESTAKSGPYTVIYSTTITGAESGLIGPTDIDLPLTEGHYYLVGLGVYYGYLYAQMDCSSAVSTDAQLTLWGALEDYSTGLPSTISASPDSGDTYYQVVQVHYPDSADQDGDSDGLTTWCGDCDDGDGTTYVGAPESCNATDDDCDGSIDEDYDADGDGAYSEALCGTLGDDCDDAAAAIFPDAVERCDGADNNCDGVVDQSRELASGTVSFGATTGTTSVSGDFFGDAYLATYDGVLASFSAWYGATAGTASFRVYESTTRTGTYSLISSTSTTVSGGAGWFDSGTLNTPIHAGRYYAVGVGLSSTGTLYYESTSTYPTLDGLTPQGYISDTTTATPASITNDPTSGRIYAQQLTVDFRAAEDHDDDLDSWSPFCGDCDDVDAALNPDAVEVCDGIDQDCDSVVDDGFDGDSDGSPSCDDCDDGNAAIHPGAPETCNGIDDDCDGAIDEDALDGVTYRLDADGDHYGDPAVVDVYCAPLTGWVTDATDCDDASSMVHPGAFEACDEVDDDCDGAIDEGWDGDLDGSASCVDCNDADPAVRPGVVEVCDGIDNDCDSLVDALTADTWETVGFGGATTTATVSSSLYGNMFRADTNTTLSSFDMYTNPEGTVNVSFRVYEATSASGPFTLVGSVGKAIAGADDWYTSGALNVDLTAGRYYLVALGSSGTTAYYWTATPSFAAAGGLTPLGYGADTTSATPTTVSTAASASRLYQARLTVGGRDPADRDDDADGTTTYCGDCDDTDAGIRPGAVEACNGADDDCDDLVDEGYDNDGDGYLDTDRCGLVGTDCDDEDATVNPGVAETCDGIDDDCDGVIDEDDAIDAPDWFRDRDADGDGDARFAASACTQPDGWAPTDTDCDDANPTTYLGAIEGCDGVDNDCDEYVDEGYPDGDSDGWAACVDCNDTNVAIRPGAEDICEDGIDQDCSGSDRACGYVGTFDLGTYGLKWHGGTTSDYVGQSVAGAFDANGDGYDDVLVGGYGYDGAASSAGAAWLLYGPLTSAGAVATAIRLDGVGSSAYAGQAVASPGDVNADGYDDLWIGAHGTAGVGSLAGAAYLVYGPVTATASLSTADAIWTGEEASNYAGWALDGAGDLDADGYADLAVGAYLNDAGGTDAGRVYVLLGATAAGGSLTSASLHLTGESDTRAGYSVASAGDTDGDGLSDLLIGAPYYGGSSYRYGAAYLVTGPITTDMSLTAADARLRGESISDALGCAVGHVDADGDGRDDLLVGAYGDDDGGTDAGAVYVVSGLVSGSVTISTVQSAKITASSSYGSMGYAMDGGDVDGDGAEDILLGDHQARPDGTDSGAAYLFYGPVAGTIGAATADVTWNGEDSSDTLGRSVAFGGDIDGDGSGDVLLGAPGEDTTVAAGAVYVLPFAGMP